MSTTSFAGAWPVLLTPFRADGAIDWPAYEMMLSWYLERAVGGLFAVCLSGEMFHLTADERDALAATAVRIAAGRVPVVATGNLGADLESHLEGIKRTADTGVSAVVLVLPTFAQTDDQLRAYVDSVLANTTCQLGLYECPRSEHRLIAPALVRELAATGRFACLKETSCDVTVLEAKCAAASGTRLAILQANTPLLLEARRLGCPGTMSISANVAPELVAAVLREPDECAEPLHRRLCAAEAVIRNGHPVASKLILVERGLPISLVGRTGASLDCETATMIRQAWRFVRDAPRAQSEPDFWRD